MTAAQAPAWLVIPCVLGILFAVTAALFAIADVFGGDRRG